MKRILVSVLGLWMLFSFTTGAQAAGKSKTHSSKGKGKTHSTHSGGHSKKT